MSPLGRRLRYFAVFAALLLLPGSTRSEDYLSGAVERCAPVKCDSAGEQGFSDEYFQDRLRSAFSSCESRKLVPQQCHACANAIYADAVKTETGERCVTTSHFETALGLCLAIVKENDPSVSEELDPELEGLAVPPTTVSEVPLVDDSRRMMKPQLMGAQQTSLKNETDRLSAAACSVNWITKPGYMIYPICAKLVCVMYGSPAFYPNQAESCCQQRSHHLGGTSWKTNCWYYAV